MSVKVSRRSGYRGGRGAGRRGGMVASQSVVQDPQNDMYCSAVPTPYGEYYPDHNYYMQSAPPELCHAHMCTMQSDFGEHLTYLTKQLFLIFQNSNFTNLFLYENTKNFYIF